MSEQEITPQPVTDKKTKLNSHLAGLRELFVQEAHEKFLASAETLITQKLDAVKAEILNDLRNL